MRVMHVTLLSSRLKRLQIYRQKMLVTGRGALFSCELVCPNAADRLEAIGRTEPHSKVAVKD